MKRTITHMCASVRGMLRWDRRYTLRNLSCITKDDGTKFKTVDEFRNALMDELAQGHEVIPCGKPCEGFDYKKGCPGHPVEDEERRDVKPDEDPCHTSS